MRFEIILEGKTKIRLPINYHYYIQGIIYNLLDADFEDLHDEGLILDNKNFKPFSFSGLFGKYQLERENNIIIFDSPVKFIFSSPIDAICDVFVNKLMKLPEVRIGNEVLNLGGIKFFKPKLSTKLRVKTLTPITVYTTIRDQNNISKTVYYNPADKEFKNMIVDNIRSKAKLLGIDKTEFNIEPFKVDIKNQEIRKYKGNFVKGWSGIYEISGDQELIDIAYNWGIGVKNSQGFGMIEVL